MQAGEGLPILNAGNWLNDISSISKNFIWKHFCGTSENYKLILYDQRGIGLSTREVKDFSLDAQTRDMETIVSGLSLENFCLFGFSNGAVSAINYAVRHPAKVSRLILFGGAVNYGSKERFNLIENQKTEKFLQSVRTKWENRIFIMVIH